MSLAICSTYVSGEVHPHPQLCLMRTYTDVGNTHCTSEGQSKCDEWGSARGKYVHLVSHLSASLLKQSLFQTFFSRLQKGGSIQNKEDKTWQGVTFRETSSPFQMGAKPFQMAAKTWNIDWSPSVKKRAGVGTQLQGIVKWTSVVPQMRLLDF